jgi:preprotein translocase subunit SecD
VTVVVSGIILYQFGTGPVKGFAVTLMIGIVASLFTAVFFTRLIFDLVYKGRRRLQTLSI